MSESTNNTQELIEEIAGAVMMVDQDDLGELTPIRGRLKQLEDLLPAVRPTTANLARVLGLVAEKIPSGQGEEKSDSLEVLANGIALLQNVNASYEREQREVVDSPELVRQLAGLAQVDPGILLGEVGQGREGTGSGVDREAFSCFVDEAEEHLCEAERNLLALEQTPEDGELLNSIFRAFHTLKGAAAYPNLPDIIQVAHAIENMFDAVRDGSLQLTREMTDTTLRGIDRLRGLIAFVQNCLEGRETTSPDIEDFLSQLARVTSQGEDPRPAVPTEEDSQAQALVFEPTTQAEEEVEESSQAPTAVAQEEAPAVDAAISDLDRSLEQIARSAEAADLNDLSILAQLQVELEKVETLLQEDQFVSRRLVESLIAAIDKVIMEECDDPDAGLVTIVEGVTMLQSLQAGFVASGAEEIDDDALLKRVTALIGGEGGTGENDPMHQAEAEEEATPEAMLAAGNGDAAAVEDEPLPDHDEAEIGAGDGGAAAPDAEKIDTTTAVEVDADIFSDFTSEAEEHLTAAENTLLALENNPEDGELLNTIFRSFHTIKGASGFLNLVDVTRGAHAIEDILDSVRKKQLTLTPAINDVILDSIDLLRELLANVGEQIGEGVVHPKDISVFLGRVTAAVAGEEAAPAPVSAPSAAPAAEVPPSPPAGPQTGGSNGQSTKAQREQQYVRVDTEKLDMLVNVVGELVITQTQVGQSPDVMVSTNQKLGKDISQLMKISNDLQEIAMALRMVPIRATFERMARMVRDLARKCGKQVTFQVRGEDTELDKNVVEEIVDPLTHMVRNAVDHGLDSPEERSAAGKSEKGQVVLEAYHRSGHIVIELSDDGRGINREKVLAKAIERGLVKAGEELSDGEVYDLVFHPGLSTAEKISDVSGRGVGMDVVRRNIEQLRGKVEVQSQPGKGSVFSIKLPLTLAIIDGMVIGVGEERYILPLTSIISSLQPQPEQISTVLNKGEMVKVQDELFPLMRMHERFGVQPRYTDPCEGLVVLIEAEGDRCCLLVDELFGLQQVVIKGLSEDLRQDPCLAGCAILGDGRVGLILDASGLTEHSRGKKNAWGEVLQGAG